MQHFISQGKARSLTDQTSQISRELQELKTNTSCHCVLLLSSSGHVIDEAGEASLAQINNISALIAANFMATLELAKLIGNRSPFKSSYHAGEDCDIYTKGINDDFLIVTIFTSKIKVGLVRFLVNQTIDVLAPLVNDSLFAVDFSDSYLNGSVQVELDQLFAV